MVRRPGCGSPIVMPDCTHGASSHQWRFARPRCGSHRQRVEPKHYPVVVVAAAGSFWCHQAQSGLRAVPRAWASWTHTAWRCSGDRRRHVAVSSHHSRRWYQHVWRSSEPAIRGCVRSALDIARQRGYRSIAFPLIGAGTGGFSPDRALEIMQDEARQIDYDGEVRFVRFSMEFFPNKE